jgi:hypothetical protein
MLNYGGAAYFPTNKTKCPPKPEAPTHAINGESYNSGIESEFHDHQK